MPDKVKDKLVYELAVVLRPELEADLKPIREKLARIVKDAGGEFTNSDEVKFERRELAYKINGETYGLYGYYRLNLSADTPDKIMNVLNITDEVLRYLLTKIDAKAEAYFLEETQRQREHREDAGQNEADKSDENSVDNE